MTPSQTQQLSALDADTAVAAFNRLLAERPEARSELVRTLRTDMPDLYLHWLDHSVGRRRLAEGV